MRKSIVQTDYRCYVCGKTHDLHSHEIFFGTSNRSKSISDKMIVYLCGEHHNLTSKGIHTNRKLDLEAKMKGQRVWEDTYGSREDFIKRYGKSWL